jgi:hypothetical protein
VSVAGTTLNQGSTMEIKVGDQLCLLVDSPALRFKLLRRDADCRLE